MAEPGPLLLVHRQAVAFPSDTFALDRHVDSIRFRQTLITG